MEKQSIGEVLAAAIEKVRGMMDANTVVGEPIVAGDITMVPISNISVGFGSGGADVAGKSPKGDGDFFSGGIGAGIKVTPVAFLVIKGDTVKMLPMASPTNGPLDRVVEMVPDLVEKVSGYLESRKKGDSEEE